MTTIRPVPPIGRPGDPSAVRSVRLGDGGAAYVDGVIMIRPRAFFPDIPANEWAAWPEVFSASGEMPMSAGGLMIERGGQRLLIDAGVGPLVSRPDRTARARSLSISRSAATCSTRPSRGSSSGARWSARRRCSSISPPPAHRSELGWRWSMLMPGFVHRQDGRRGRDDAPFAVP